MDLYKWVTNNPRSNIARLYQHGADYPNATTTTPSGGLPGMLALTTGGTPKTTGVYGEDAYDRSLYPPGSSCATAAGTEVIYDETIAVDSSQLFADIDPANLPLTRDSGGNCVPVYPHQFLKASTIFGVVQASGRRTSWADNHQSYEMLAGPAGKGLSEFFAPVAKSLVTNGGTSNVVNLAGSLAACNSSNSVGTAPTMDYAKCLPSAQAYDDVKVQSVINKIDGFSADGSKKWAVPTILGMNFIAVEAAQKLPMGGYTNAVADPGPLLLQALQHVDFSIGRILTELETKLLIEKTLIILTAKHGQAPIDPNLWRTEMGAAGSLVPVDDPRGYVQAVDSTVDNAWAPFVNPNSGRSPVTHGHVQTGGDVGIVWLQDQNNANVSGVVSNLNDPMNDLAMGATVRPQGSIFSTNIASGTELAQVFGDAQSSSDLLAAARAPNVFVQPELGVIYTTSTDEFADHGGGANEDINVPLVVSNTGIVQHVSIYEPVSTTRVAPTILRALRLDATKLTAAVAEGTEGLPGINWGPGTYQAGSTINAVDYSSHTNTQIEGTPPYVSYFDAGSSICFNDVYLTDVASITATIASSSSGGVFSIRIDSPTGTQIGRYTVQATGGWTAWSDVSIPITATTGLHTLCFRGESGTGIANLLKFLLVPVCIPECTGATCSSDGCGGTCGTCAFGFTCNDPSAQCIVPPTKYGLTPPLTPSIPAPAFDVQSGVQIGNSNTTVGSVDANDSFCYYGVDLTGVQSLQITYASATAGGVVSFRIDGVNGTQIGAYTVRATGGGTTYTTRSIPITAPGSVHALCVRGETGSNIGTFRTFDLSASPVLPRWTVGSTIPASPPDSQSGTTVEPTYISYFDSGDYVCYDDVDMAGVNSIVASVASSNGGGVFSARLGSPTGTQIATFVAPNTGSWTTWTNVTVGISAISTGPTTLCFRGESGSGIANLQSFYLSSTPVVASWSVGSTIPAYPPSSQNGTTPNAAGFVGDFDSGDSVCYSSVDMTGVKSIVATVAVGSGGGGTFSVRIGSGSGTQVGTFATSNTGGWSNWTTVTANVTATAGVVTLCFRGESGTGIANLKQFYLSPTGTTATYSLGSTITAAPPSSQSGVTASGGTITYFDSGDWFCYDGVDLTGVHNIVASAASGSSGGQISVRIGSSSGSQIGSYGAWNTGGYSNYQDYWIGISTTSGAQKLCFYGASGSGIANFRSFRLAP